MGRGQAHGGGGGTGAHAGVDEQAGYAFEELLVHGFRLSSLNHSPKLFGTSIARHAALADRCEKVSNFARDWTCSPGHSDVCKRLINSYDAECTELIVDRGPYNDAARARRRAWIPNTARTAVTSRHGAIYPKYQAHAVGICGAALPYGQQAAPRQVRAFSRCNNPGERSTAGSF